MMMNSDQVGGQNKLLNLDVPDSVKRDSVILMCRFMVEDETQRERQGAQVIAGAQRVLAESPERYNFSELLGQLARATHCQKGA